MQYASMQTLFDSLCQCLGPSSSLPRDEADCILHPDQSSPHQNNGGSQTHTHTPTAENGSPGPTSRRTSRLELKDKQWDALFEAVNPNVQHIHKHGGESPSSSPSGGRGRAAAEDQDPSPYMETARAIAQAKQAANPSRYHMAGSFARDSPPPTSSSTTTAAARKSSIRCTTKSHKRKRPISSRDDIFRSRKFGPSVRRSGCQDSNCMNPISKFLSNHQGFANALCFATPVRDEEDEEDELKEEDPHDGASLASDANTLNTCEDSMMMLDRKLALMSKNQPPMPLFYDFKVNQNEPEGLRRMVEDETHSSTNLMNLWRQQRQEENNPLDVANVIVPSSSSGSSGSDGANRGRPRVRYPVPIPPAIPEDETPPQMKAASSSSGGSSRSGRSRNSPQIGEI